MKQNQKSHVTKIDRYPELFKEITSIIPCPNQILSFGCSTGEECITLNNLYFPNIKIIGLDINEEIIISNKNKNIYKNIEYFSNLENITEKSDLIFANSVLCRWPESTVENYTYQRFEHTLKFIDNLLNKDGYLCIYNSKYLFTETDLFLNKYQKIDTIHTETGFVTKYHKNNRKINFNYPYFLFKKIAF